LGKSDDRFNRACVLWDEGRTREAFRLFMEAAGDGDVSCYVNVGYFYDAGVGVRKNTAKALYWYRRAHRRGDSSGTHNIGTIYRDLGMKRRALQWFDRALKMGNDSSALEIGRIYLKDKNLSAAIRYLKLVEKSDRVCEDDASEASALLKTTLRARNSAS